MAWASSDMAVVSSCQGSEESTSEGRLRPGWQAVSTRLARLLPGQVGRLLPEQVGRLLPGQPAEA